MQPVQTSQLGELTYVCAGMLDAHCRTHHLQGKDGVARNMVASNTLPLLLATLRHRQKCQANHADTKCCLSLSHDLHTLTTPTSCHASPVTPYEAPTTPPTHVPFTRRSTTNLSLVACPLPPNTRPCWQPSEFLHLLDQALEGQASTRATPTGRGSALPAHPGAAGVAARRRTHHLLE